NSGGAIIAMGQDMSAVLNSDVTDGGTFFYNSVLGGNWLRDSVTGFITPTLPIIPTGGAPVAFQDLLVSVGAGGDGADNQFFIDEIAVKPFKDPDNPESLDPYVALLKYSGPGGVQQNIVSMAHRDQPTLERPGVSYLGRSVYATFGLEGVNNGASISNREELLQTFLNWAWDEPTATILNTTPPNSSNLTTFSVSVSSTLTTTTGVRYRWDFGDGTGAYGPYTSSVASHTYDTCGLYTVRVEAVDTFGNKTIGTLTTPVSRCTNQKIYLPLIIR
ncbi:MAG: PKD domain-containing protein, partial [Anaerolineales bacterium]